MNALLATLEKHTTWKNALIILVLLVINVILLDAVDRPLLKLAAGEPKLDLRFGYDLQTVEMLFSAYGERGRAIYAWNLLVDTTFPILGALAGMLFIFLAVDNRRLRQILILVPLVFVVTDLIENVLFWGMLLAYPALSPPLVWIASLITQVKRAAFYTGLPLLVGSILFALVKWVHYKRRSTIVE